MKTLKSIIIIAGICIASVAIAQTDSRNSFLVGFKGGVNNSSLFDTHGQSFVANSLWGPVFGGWLSIPICTYVGIQPEVLYSEEGYSGSGMTDELAYSYTDRENFLDVPLLIQFKPSPNLYLLGGPEYSYLLSRNYTFSQGTTSETTQQSFSNENLRRNILGLMFGMDINFSHLTLGARVAWDLQDNDGNGTSTLPRYRNIWGQVTLGFRI